VAAETVIKTTKTMLDNFIERLNIQQKRLDGGFPAHEPEPLAD
jgi:hypothetical protein